MASSDSGYKVYYFPIRGRGEPVRLALLAAGVKFDDELVPFSTWGEEMKPDLLSKHDVPFAQLPFMTVPSGDHVSQMNAMLMYIGESHGLAGDGSVLQRSKITEFLSGLDDLRSVYTKVVYGGAADSDAQVAKMLLEDTNRSALFGESGRLARVNSVLALKRAAEGTPAGQPVFAVGKALTVADISLAAMLDDFMVILPQAAEFEELKLVHEHVFALPAVAEYVKAAPANRKQVNGNALGSGNSL